MNLGKIMQQAQEMQKKMQEMQEGLVDLTIEGTAGGGMVTVILNGKGEMTGLKLDKDAVDPNDVEMLEDLIVAAFNDGKGKVETEVAEKMGQVTQGMQLPPGFNMPF